MLDILPVEIIFFLRRRTVSILATLAAGSLGLCHGANAGDATIALKIHDHHFVPEEIHVAAGEKRQLEIANEDATAEEFESHSLHREKIIPANSRVTVFIGPLKPGRYEFIGEFNRESAHGALIAQ